MQLREKVVLITGANGGLGSSVTRAFLDAGARVAGVAPAIANADFPNPSFEAFPADLNSADAARALTAKVVAKWGTIDALVHLVGAFTGGKTVHETDDAAFEKMLDLNLRLAFYMFRAVLTEMRAKGGGRILAIGSRTAVEPQPMLGAYSASKAALISLVRTVALEDKDRGITANVILPEAMDTPANRAVMPQASFSAMIQPAQVAALLVHLVSDQASQITGAVIPIYGASL